MTIEAQAKPLPIQETLSDNPEFHMGLQALAEHLPELADHQEAIRQRGDELIDEFGISPELFEDTSHVLLFSAIADRYVTLEDGKESMPAEAYTGEKEFIGDAVMLLALDKSAHFDEVKDSVGVTPKGDAIDRERFYDRFTNKQVSQELTDAIEKGGLVDDVKKRMGVTPENEDVFMVRVLNIGQQSVLDDMRPRLPLESDRESLAAYNNASAAFRDYAEGLDKNRKQFMESGQGNGMFAIGNAWVEHADDGTQTLVVLLPTAEQILYQQETPGLHGAPKVELERLKHEFTHTQGGINIGQFYGIGGEELRANYFPRRKKSYGDVSQFVLDLRVITGLDMNAYFDGHLKGGTAEEYFLALAENAGLHGALEIAIMPPASIVSEDRPMQQQVAAHLGSFDEIGKRIYTRARQDPVKAAAIDARLNDLAQSWAAEPDSVAKNELVKRRDMFDLHFITDEVEKRITRIRSQAGGDQ